MRKESTNDNRNVHPYIVTALSSGVKREGWTTSVIRRKGEKITIRIVEKKV